MRFMTLVAAALAWSAFAGQSFSQQAGPPQFKDLKDKMSYVIGLSIGRNAKSDQMNLDVNLLTRGLQDGLSGANPALSEQEIQQTVTEFQQQRAAEESKRIVNASDKNKQEGEAFLEANKKKEGVVTLPSGLQYRVLKSGNGPSPKPGDSVTVNYVGKLLNGEEFDSSIKRGTPATFGVSQVIPGWSEALQLMHVGDKWELYIPSSLAYGMHGAGPMIGPNATLVFEVELLNVMPGNPPPGSK